MLRKSCVFFVVVLFIGINLIIPQGICKDTIDRLSQQNDSLSGRGYFYGYCGYDPSGQNPPGIITFDTPDNIILLGPGICPNFLTCGDIDIDGNWYGIDYAGGLYLIEYDGTMTFIAPTISMNGLTYDTFTNSWYGCTSSSLFSVNITTGAPSLLGNFGSDFFMGDIAFNYKNDLYGVAYNSEENVLCTIDKITGEVIVIGPLDLTWVVDAAYDRNTGILYVSGIRNNNPLALFTCDVGTAESIIVNYFEGGIEVDGVVIPYVVPYLIAEFIWTPSDPTPGEMILFNASLSYDSDGLIILYEWDWNNDSVYEEAFTIPTATQLWTSPGDYNVTLRVTDDMGLTATKYNIIEVVSNPPSSPVIYGPDNGFINVSYTFTTDQITNPNGDSFYCKWDWGDGNITGWLGPYPSGSIISASHTWTYVGVYEIRVKIKGSGGESNWSEPHKISIFENQPPEKPIIKGPVVGTSGSSIQLYGRYHRPRGEDVFFPNRLGRWKYYWMVWSI